MNDYILEMRNITKSFPGVKALDNINLKIKRGEIHCIVGENGAGKSTLMKILSGVYPYGTYTGDLIYNGVVQCFKNITSSEKEGIVTVYQELALIPELSVIENIYFGHEFIKGRTIDWNKIIKYATEMMKKVRLDVDPSNQVKNLGIGKQQLVEIAKALSKNAQLLILDEPTAALNEDDSENMLHLISELKKQGITCILISHKLREITAIADTITILRDGMLVNTINMHETPITIPEIIKYMVGREITNIYPKRMNKKLGNIALEVRNWSIANPKTGKRILNNVNFNVRAGEIIGIQGLMGSGRTECALSLFGNPMRYKLLSGEIYINGQQKRFANPKAAIKAGLAYVTEDRKGNGLILIQDIRYNITIAALEKLTKGISINQNEEIYVANKYRDSLGIKTPSIKQKVENLSGGNQQKVQIAKWMNTMPKVLILDEPTRGIDVGAKSEIYSIMNRLAEMGMSIIMISSELPEVLGVSDRIYVMSAGTIVGELSAEEATEQKVTEMAFKR